LSDEEEDKLLSDYKLKEMTYIEEEEFTEVMKQKLEQENPVTKLIN